MDDEMVQPDDILNTIRYLLNLSQMYVSKDIVFEMKKKYYIALLAILFIIIRASTN